MSDLPPEFLHRLQAVKGKRSRIVIAHILENGYITTETLETIYGYKHPPRAIQDVRDQGIPLESFNVKNENGRTIAAYRFPEVIEVDMAKIGGRQPFPKTLKARLVAETNGKCSLCGQAYPATFLQIDHRVPYQVAGDQLTENHMLVCRSCNRSKAWTCEHCPNGLTHRETAVCLTCYWCSPDNHTHIALINMRRLELIWLNDEKVVFDALMRLATPEYENVAEFVKQLLSRYVRGEDLR